MSDEAHEDAHNEPADDHLESYDPESAPTDGHHSSGTEVLAAITPRLDRLEHQLAVLTGLLQNSGEPASEQRLQELVQRLSRLENDVARNAGELAHLHDGTTGQEARADNADMRSTLAAIVSALGRVEVAVTTDLADRVDRLAMSSVTDPVLDPGLSRLESRLDSIGATSSEVRIRVERLADVGNSIAEITTAMKEMTEALGRIVESVEAASAAGTDQVITALIAPLAVLRAEAVGLRRVLRNEIQTIAVEAVPITSVASVDALVQANRAATESVQAEAVELIRRDLLSLASTVKAAADASARLAASEAAASAAARVSHTVTSAVRSVREAQGDDEVAELVRRVGSLAALVEHALDDSARDDDAGDLTRARVANDITERLARLREAAAGVADAVRAEAQRRRHPL